MRDSEALSSLFDAHDGFICGYLCSEFRQVPDNQEVFANAQTDQCVIIELLQHETAASDAESAKFFFNEIASTNGCAPNDVTLLHSELLAPESDNAPKVDRPHATSIFVGDQRVAKFKEGDAAKNVVRVYVGNVRYVALGGLAVVEDGSDDVWVFLLLLGCQVSRRTWSSRSRCRFASATQAAVVTRSSLRTALRLAPRYLSRRSSRSASMTGTCSSRQEWV
jgi:hypothetical protein